MTRTTTPRPIAAPDRHPLRHWLRSRATWAVLAAARLTHPHRVIAAARGAGMRPHWRGMVRIWAWPELQQLAELETERHASGTATRTRRAGSLVEVLR